MLRRVEQVPLVPLSIVVVTDQLAKRPPGQPDHQALNAELLRLAHQTTGSPRRVFQELANAALHLCDAHSAGISLLEEEDGQKIFRWRGVAGKYASHILGTVPHVSPCGIAIKTDRGQLMSRPARHFTYLARIKPLIEELLVVPFRVGDGSLGTVWVMSHDHVRRFDREDERVLKSLAEFSAAALEIATSIASHQDIRKDLERTTRASLRDNEDLKAQVLELKQTELAVSRLAAIVESSDDAIISNDLNGIIKSWNKGAERIFGYTADEVVGRPVSILMTPEHINEMPEILNRIRQGEHVHHYETVRRRKDGQTIPVSLTVSPIRSAAGQIIGASKIARDISDRHRAAMELMLKNEELGRLNRDLETFAYSASHDLQEPLRTMAMSAQLLQRRFGDRLPQEAADLLDTILNGSKRMKDLIDDLLTYARTAKPLEDPLLGVDAAKVIARVLEDLKAVIQASNATITFERLPTVLIHESRLGQVFQNLISNALKYRGKEIPRIRVSSLERDGLAIFSVDDNGLGIEPQYAEKIFEPFKRLHSRARIGGSGIGLAICQRILEQYGGRIWLEKSVPGVGSTFCFAIPLQPRGV